MKVNWKVRFKNKVWLASFCAIILSFVYTMLGMFDIYPSITKNEVLEIVNNVLMFLSLIGVIVDPTTEGLGDSERAMGYEVPYSDAAHRDDPIENIIDPPAPEAATAIDIPGEEYVDEDEPESEGETGT